MIELILFDDDGETLATWNTLEDLTWNANLLGAEVKEEVRLVMNSRSPAQERTHP